MKIFRWDCPSFLLCFSFSKLSHQKYWVKIHIRSSFVLDEMVFQNASKFHILGKGKQINPLMEHFFKEKPFISEEQIHFQNSKNIPLSYIEKFQT